MPQPGPATGGGIARLFQRIDYGLRAIEGVAVMLSSLLIMVMMLLISADALSRYTFNQPLSFTLDLVTMYLMPGAMFFALAFTLREGGHVNVDLLLHRLSPRARTLVTGIVLLISVPVVAVIVWQMAGKTFDSWERGSAITGFHIWPIWPSEILVPLGMGLLLLRLIYLGCINLFAGVTGQTIPGLVQEPIEDVVVEDTVR